MDFIDDWGRIPRAAPASKLPSKGPAKATSRRPEEISKAMEDSGLPGLSLHFYEDVGYPWVQVTFDATKVIHPNLVIQVGKALAKAAEADCVYFNSLRPMAIYFLLQIEPAFDTPRDLPITRYGAPLAEVIDCWENAPSATAG